MAQLDKAQAAKRCDAILDVATVIPQQAGALREAFRSGWADVEDAMHYFAAKQHMPYIQYLVSRNTKDFKAASGIAVLNPADFVRECLM